MSIHSHLPFDQSTSHARIPAGGIHLIASIDSVSEAQFTASFFGSTKALHGEVAIPSAETSTHNHSNQQFSITAVTISSGSVAERYAYSAYGEPTICDASGSTLASSAINNRYSYTGREWDATVGLYHFRARWMSPKTGRFLGRDPIGYWDSNNAYLFVLSNPTMFVDPSGLSCWPENHHWFPQTYRTQIESRCSSIGFRIDYFTTPLNKCKDEDKNCSVHGWIHGNNLPNRPIRSPDWNTEAIQIFNGTGTCCAFLIEMAAAIAVGYAELADEFADCDQPKCYRLETWRLPRHPEGGPRPDTTKLFSDIVAACRRGSEPERLPRNVNQDGGGLISDPTIDILIGGPAGLGPKVLPKVFPRVLPKVIPKDPPIKKFPIEIPRRAA